MITGFNTDIKHKGVTYHVQTEDKGLKTPLILSLVYEGGTILASKRSPYEDLIADFDEKVLEDRLNRQHNLICAAIRAGRIDDLKRMTLDASSAKQKKALDEKNNQKEKVKDKDFVPKNVELLTKVEKEPTVDNKPKAKEIASVKYPEIKVKKSEVEMEIDESQLTKQNQLIKQTEKKSEVSNTEVKLKAEAKTDQSNKVVEEQPEKINTSTQPIEQKPKPKSKVDNEKISESPVREKAEPKIPEIIQGIPKPTETPVWDIPIIEDVKIVDDGFIEDQPVIDQVIVLPPDAVEIVGDLEQFGSLLEQELKVKILGENPFMSGERKNVNILVCRGNENSAVADANVMVKVIGSDFRPLIYHSKADSNGVASVFLKLPNFRSGRAALLIRAMVDGEETELRRAISPQ